MRGYFKNFVSHSLRPEPKAGQTFDLPILGSVLTYHVSYSLFPYLIDARNGPPPVMAMDDELVSNMQSVNIFYPFRKFVGKLWTLWELVLIGEPILLLSPSPVISSEAVLALVSLISPVSTTVAFLIPLTRAAFVCGGFPSFLYHPRFRL